MKLTKNESKKLLLAKALKEEKERLPEYSIFGEKNDTKDYDKAIEYLKTGKIPKNYENSELLIGVIDDFDMMCSDYGV